MKIMQRKKNLTEAENHKLADYRSRMWYMKIIGNQSREKYYYDKIFEITHEEK